MPQNNPKQEVELRDSIAKIMASVGTKVGCDEYDYCWLEAKHIMELINTHTTKLLNEQLDRLSMQVVNAQTYNQPDGSQFGSLHNFLAIPLSAIEAERNKLKESKDE